MKRPNRSAVSAAPDTLSTRALARAMGVSESSIKRWVDDGSIRSARTVGGHRRIRRADAIRFVRERHADVPDPEALGLVAHARRKPPALTEGGRELADLLTSGAEGPARGLLASWYLAGESLAAIVDGPLRTALASIGTLWTHDRAGIFLEHRALQLAIAALAELRSFVAPPADAPVAVGGAIAGDPYQLPSMAAALVLTEEGFEAVNLGADVPLPTFAEAMERLDAVLVWVSASVAADGPAIASELTELAGRAASRRTHLVVGGRAREALGALAGPNLFTGSSMAELAAFARGLQAPRR